MRIRRLSFVIVCSFVLSALLAACTATAPRTSAPPPASPDAGMTLPPDYSFPAQDTVRVATWNVENFVDPHDNPYIDSRTENNPSPDQADRLRRFVKAVRAMNADVLVLQEFESEAYLEQIAEEHLADMGYRFFAATESPDWFQNVILASRYPLGVVRSYADVVTPIEGITTDDGAPAAQSLTNNRIWMADVRMPEGSPLTLVGAHLKAGRSARDAGWRIGQVRFLHTELNEMLARRPAAEVLIAGDLNSLSDSPELRLLLNDPARPAPDSLRAGTGAWMAQFSDPLAGRPTYTYPSENPTRQLDYLLVNRALHDDLLPGSARVAAPLPADSMAATSDHLPVVATFRIR